MAKKGTRKSSPFRSYCKKKGYSGATKACVRAASKGSKRKVAKKHSKRLRNLGAYAYPAKRH